MRDTEPGAIDAVALAFSSGEGGHEFAMVRQFGRNALYEIGVPVAPASPDDEGTRRPVGVVGTMTHGAGHRAFVVSGSTDLSSSGGGHPDRPWDRLLFCATEPVFNAWFPVTHQWLDLVDVSIELSLEAGFRARVCVERPAGVEHDESGGRWLLGRGLLLTMP